MRFLPFRVLFLCVLMPPILFMGTVKGFEEVLQAVWRSGLQDSLITDTAALLEGRERVQSMIERNIAAYFKDSFWVRLGAQPNIIVKTETGKALYPEEPGTLPGFIEDLPSSLLDNRFEMVMDSTVSQNAAILQQGVVYSLEVSVPRKSLLANLILASYILLFVVLLYQTYRIRIRRAEEAEQARKQEFRAMQERLDRAQERVAESQNREESYNQEIARLRAALSQADNRLQETEEEAVAELEALEQKLQQSIRAREQKEREIESLTQEMEALQSQGAGWDRKQEKHVDQALKRFKTLYKNLEFHRRAVEGFLQLHYEQQLKSEELIHRMDRDAASMTVKRKVFSKTGALPALETEFSHKGRIYWRRNASGKAVVLAIGTKNTQRRDLRYLEGLNGKDA